MSVCSAAALAAALATFATQSFAATDINVIEEGEGGGAMSLKLDPSSVKAGPAVFHAKNDAVGEEHEMIVVKLKSADEKIPVDAATHRIDEAKLESLGEVGDIKPGESGDLEVTLEPGNYLVLCNIKGHYEAGMASHLTATP